MNIFVLDGDPAVAARYHCDKHVPKMVLETAQMLCSVRHRYGLDAPYKLAHANHPCTKWAGDSVSNYRWLWLLGFFLGKEYEKRFGKTHKSSAVIMKCIKHSANMPDVGLTEFAQAMPDQYKKPDAVDAYRAYYKGDKVRFASWDRGQIPNWW